jgi:hypothetical protein
VVPVLVIAALVAVSAATSSDTRRDLDEARTEQALEVATLRPGPGERSLVIAPPNFPRDTYVPVPVPARFDGAHLVAMDPTRGAGRFDLIDRFADRSYVDVIRVQPTGKPFDRPVRVRRDLTVVTGPTVDLAAQTFGAGEPYAGIDGAEEPVPADEGRVSVTLAAEDTPGAITVPASGPVWVVLGIEDFELHYLARVVDGEVQVIEPPTPIRHYHFEGHDPIDVIEDTTVRIVPA